MRRITAALAALAFTTGVLITTTATTTASAQAEIWPGVRCVGSSLEMFATNGLCVLPRYYPVLVIPA
ncbi:hypothetical protein [Amycolatopsis plumensis]|uniref:Uncharacterized protein n=1 Tax=Amycolatopsis plumensis TaxID=236508 RepID=A0ABV5TWS1_9PSEU